MPWEEEQITGSSDLSLSSGFRHEYQSSPEEVRGGARGLHDDAARSRSGMDGCFPVLILQTGPEEVIKLLIAFIN